jgi:hypothetical protein
MFTIQGGFMRDGIMQGIAPFPHRQLRPVATIKLHHFLGRILNRERTLIEGFQHHLQIVRAGTCAAHGQNQDFLYKSRC